MDYPLTLQPMLERANQLFGRKEIVTRYPWGVHRYTYAEMYKRTSQLAHALQKLGLKSGDRVGSFAWNSGRHLELYFGIPCSGAVIHTLNIRLHPDQLAYIINHAEDQVIFADASALNLLEPVYDQLTSVRHVVVMAEPGQPLPKSSIPDLIDYETLIGSEATHFDWPEIDERSAAAMCYTSGTTGNPKGALYTHRSIYIHSLSAATPVTFGLDETDVVMPLVPMFHVLSWGMPYASTWLGAKQVYTTSFMTPPDLAELIESEKVTYTAGVPTIWLGLFNYLESNTADISSVRRIPVGGAAAPRSLIESFAEKHNIEIVHAWGMTEMTPIGSLSYLKSYMHDLSANEQMNYLSKQGLSSLTVEFRLIDDEGRQVPWDGVQPGELQVRGPHVISAYYDDPRSADSFVDGWFRTGDVATIDPEGYMQIVDRTKDLIKSGGEWISTVDLENSIMAHPDVLEAAVVAIPDPKWTERPIALVVPNPNSSQCEPDSIRALLLNSFERWQCPDHFILFDAIPKTSVGKFDKKVIREHYRDHATPNL